MSATTEEKIIGSDLLTQLNPPTDYAPLREIAASDKIAKDPGSPSLLERIGDFKQIETITANKPRGGGIDKISIQYSESTGLLALTVNHKSGLHQDSMGRSASGKSEYTIILDYGEVKDPTFCPLINMLRKKLCEEKQSNAMEKGVSVLDHAIFEQKELQFPIRYIEGKNFTIKEANLAGVQFGSLENVSFQQNTNLDGAVFRGNWKNVEIESCTARFARAEIECSTAKKPDHRNRIMNCDIQGFDAGHSNLTNMAVTGCNIIAADFGNAKWKAKDGFAGDKPEDHLKARNDYLRNCTYSEDSTRFFADQDANAACMKKLNAISYETTAPAEMSVDDFRKSLSGDGIVSLAGRYSDKVPPLLLKDGENIQGATVTPHEIPRPTGDPVRNTKVTFRVEPSADTANPSQLIATIAEFSPGAAAGQSATNGDGVQFTVKEIGAAWGVVARFAHAALDEELRMWSMAFAKQKDNAPTGDSNDGSGPSQTVGPTEGSDSAGQSPAPEPGAKARALAAQGDDLTRAANLAAGETPES